MSENKLVVLAAMLVQTGTTVSLCEREIIQRPVNFHLLHGLLFTIVPELQHIMDNIARICQEICAIKELENKTVYFSSYPFRVRDFVYLDSYQNDISQCVFNGLDFEALSDTIKNEMPYFGDFFDSELIPDFYDMDGTGLLYGIIVPVYKMIVKMIVYMGIQYSQEFSFPVC